MPYFPTPKSLPPTQIINGHEMVYLAGGVFAKGSQVLNEEFGDCPPRMVKVEPFAAGVTPVTEGQFRFMMDRPGNADAPVDHPVICVSVADCEAYLQARNHGRPAEKHIGFLTEAELEFLARGPVVDIRQLMEAEGLRDAAALAEFIGTPEGDYLENFVAALELSATIIASPHSDSEGFKRLIDGASPVFAWRTWGTRSGRFNAAEAWINKNGTVPVSCTERLSAYGISDVMGNVWSRGKDSSGANILRGSSWLSADDALFARAGYRNGDLVETDENLEGISFRVGASDQDSH